MAATSLAAIAGFGAAGNALLSAFKKPKSLPAPSPLAPPPSNPVFDPTQVEQIGQRRRQAAFAAPPPATLLTGPAGLQNNAAAQRSTLLGR